MLDAYQRDIKTGILSEELINIHVKVATKTRRANWTEKQRQPAGVEVRRQPSDRHPVLALTYGMLRAALFVLVLAALPDTIAGILLPEEFNLQIKPLLERRASEGETNHVQKNK